MEDRMLPCPIRSDITAVLPGTDSGNTASTGWEADLYPVTQNPRYNT